MAKHSLRVEQEELRARMRAAGMVHDEIAVDFARRYRLRPRAAHRVAHGWTQQQACDRINAHAARTGRDPLGNTVLGAPRLSEVEHWPLPPHRRPTPGLLVLLAEVYGTEVHNLLDLEDRELIPPTELLLLDKIGALAGQTRQYADRLGAVERSHRDEASPETPVAQLPARPDSAGPMRQLPPQPGVTSVTGGADLSLVVEVGSAAVSPRGVPELGGQWWAAWQSFKDGVELVAVQRVLFDQVGELIGIAALARGRPVEDGGYLWRGELRVFEGGVLMGWYAAADGAVRSLGTLYLTLHTQGRTMVGRWVGLSYDGPTVTGWGVFARSQEAACRVMRGITDVQVMTA
jgi:hypothetical protein